MEINIMRKLSLYFLAFLFCMTSCDHHDDDRHISVSPFHTAEYGFARTVLMCEPGEEFDFAGSSKVGVLSEHRELASKLRQVGIEVLEMRPSIDESPGTQNIGHSIVYVRDPIICSPCGLVVGRMSNKMRSTEPELACAFLRKYGQEPVYRIQSEESVLEGGDYLPMGSFCLIGCGKRTNMAAVRELMQADVLGADTVAVVNDRSGTPREMHLDTYLNAIDHDLMTLTCDRYDAAEGDEDFLTADVYVRRHGTHQYVQAVSNQPLLTFLNARGIHVVRINKIDALMLGGNYLCIAPRHIIASEGLTAEFYHALTELGVQIDTTPTDNLRTGKGGIRCATQVIARE